MVQPRRLSQFATSPRVARLLTVLIGLTLIFSTRLGAELVAQPELMSPVRGSRGQTLNRSANGDGAWQIAAQASYRLFHESCSPLGSPSTEDDKADNAYLGNLAEARAKAVDCDGDKLRSILDDPAKTTAYAKDFAKKLTLILEYRKAASNHEDSLQYKSQLGKASDPKSDYYTEIKEYNKIVASEEAVLASIPFIHLQKVQALLRNQLQLYNDGRGPQPSPADIEKSILALSGSYSALRGAANDLERDSLTLHKGAETKGSSLNTNMRESLAQDRSLIDSVYNYAKLGDKEKATACRVDAKYGKGAKTRDNVLMAAQVGLGLATFGSSGLASAATVSTRIATLRGAVTAGEVAARSANILSKAAIVTDLTAAGIQSAKACTNGAGFRGTLQGESCDDFKIEQLNQDNCVLKVGLNLIGAAAMTKKGQQILGDLVTGARPTNSRFAKAESALGRKLSAEENAAVLNAHRVGEGELGKDGLKAGIGNYTDAQLRQKAQILKDAGFSDVERRILIEKGLVGSVPATLPQGISSPYVSYIAGDGNRYAAKIIGSDGAGGYKIIRQNANGLAIEDVIPESSVATMKESNTAKIAFERSGKPEVDRVRDAVANNIVTGDQRYISYIDKTGERVPAKIISSADGEVKVQAYNPVTNAVEDRTLESKDLLTARTSDTAKKMFSQYDAAPAGPGSRTQFARQIFAGQISAAQTPGGPAMSVRSFPSQTGGPAIDFNTSLPIDARKIAAQQGRITEIRASAPQRLPAGTYTYAVTEEGTLVVGKVEDSFEFGVKHIHLLNGRAAPSAGELQVAADGSYIFNNDSGSIVRAGLLDQGVDPAVLKSKSQTSLKQFLGSEGTPTNASLLPNTPPTRARLWEYCNQPAFCEAILNARSCKMVFGAMVCP